MSDQTEAAMQTAITNHLMDEGFIEEGEFVGDWIANIYLPSVNDRPESAYALLTSSSNLPDHVAVGLLTNALDRVRGITGDGGDE
ncbi:hypothetical protein [Microbacterium sp. W4I20]|uniref:hypothetical protein n=1 Tax=Microbacterium sp. W4I20 TaxID=3042262 RepID=UPI0027D89B6A|nr:hypothetical protein [Microbacterium sp. W4I20]